jgi:hypothetical protein
MVDAVTKKYPEIFKFETRKAQEHADEIGKYELGDHGVVCLDGKTGESLWSHPGHQMSQEVLDKGVKDLLAKLQK